MPGGDPRQAERAPRARRTRRGDLPARGTPPAAAARAHTARHLAHPRGLATGARRCHLPVGRPPGHGALPARVRPGRDRGRSRGGRASCRVAHPRGRGRPRADGIGRAVRRTLFQLAWWLAWLLEAAGRAVAHVAAGALTSAELRAAIARAWEHYGADEAFVTSGFHDWERETYD